MRLPDHLIPDRAVVLGPGWVRFLYDHRAKAGHVYDEMRAGELVSLPVPDNQHREVQFLLSMALGQVVPDEVLPGSNVSGLADDWMTDFRCPDVVVYLPDNPAVRHGTHFQGGPDLLVEIDMPGDDPVEKLPYYAAINTREVLIVRRRPWSLELHQLQAGELELAGRSDLAAPAVLASGVLPLTFQLVAGPERPQILVAYQADGRTWLV